jgi:hypothetical protein
VKKEVKLKRSSNAIPKIRWTSGAETEQRVVAVIF